MERNFISQFQRLSGIKGACLSQTDSLTEFVSGYQAPWMNGVLVSSGSHADLNNLIASTLSKYACPMVWRVGVLSSEPQRLKEALTASGLYPLNREPGMVLDRKRFSYSQPLPEFTVEVVQTQEQVNDYLIPFADAYDLPQEVVEHFRQFMMTQVEGSTSQAWFTGYVEDVPVSTTYYLTDNEVTMIYAVGTLSKFRNRGYARRTMEAAIKHAWQHFDAPIALYSSAMGHSLYASMGFEDVCFVEQYIYTPLVVES